MRPRSRSQRDASRGTTGARGADVVRRAAGARRVGVARGAVAAAMLVLGAAEASPARAQPNDAKSLFDEGTAALERGENAAAVEKLRQSLALRDSPSTRINLGIGYEHLGQMVRAICHYGRAVQLFEPGDAERGKAEESVQRLSPKVGRLEVVVKAPGAVGKPELSVNGQKPAVLDPCAEEPESGRWVMRVEPGAHALVVKADKDERAESATVAAGEKVRVVVEVIPPVVIQQPVSADWRWPAGFAVGGIGVATLIGGAVMGGLALDRRDAANRECPDPGACNTRGVGAAADARLFGDVSTGLIVGGALATGLGVGLAIWGRPTPQTLLTVRPVFSKSIFGLSANGEM